MDKYQERLRHLMRGAVWSGVPVDELRARKRALDDAYAEVVRQRDEAIDLVRDAAEVCEGMFGNCDPDCECIIHALVGYLAEVDGPVAEVSA